MGIGIVLLFWAVVGFVLACGAAAALGICAAWLTRGVVRGRRILIIAAIAFPFGCLAWSAVIFVFQATVNEVWLGRDAGIGDGWRCPLPNGYSILMIDVTDWGTIENSKTQQEVATEVVHLQVAGRYLLGDRDRSIPTRTDSLKPNVDSYFLVDTQAGVRQDFQRKEDLETSAANLGIATRLEPISEVYSRYRFSWFDILTAFLFGFPPLACFGGLAWWTIRLRKSLKPRLNCA